MEDKIQTFRQPLVTATGIILGFILNYSISFVKSESETSDLIAYFTGLCILIGEFCLILVLSRILKMNYSRKNPEKYYNRTLQIFLFGVSISFFGVFIDMFSNFMTD